MLLKLIFPDGTNHELKKWPYPIPRKGSAIKFNGKIFRVRYTLFVVNGLDYSMEIILKELSGD